MPNKDWDPDPKAISEIKDTIYGMHIKDLINGRVFNGQKSITWLEALDEIEEGTEFGRLLYYAYTDNEPEQ